MVSDSNDPVAAQDPPTAPVDEATTGSRWSMTPRTFERVTYAAMILIGLIVVTGGAVRLTGSGLGCTDWPTCENNKVYPSWHLHGWIEFGNRLVTGLVSIAVILAVLGALVRVPRRRDLTWLSLGLVGGVLGQIVLGGIVVLSHLWPPLVMGHFVLSMVLVANAVILVHHARRPDRARRRVRVDERAGRLGMGLVVATAVAILTGTVVTGTGPHSGSNDGTPIERLPFEISDVVRIHGVIDMVVLAIIVALLVTLFRARAPRGVLGRLEVVLVLGLLQAAIGYTQYFTGVPELLVGLHILGATLLWGTVLWFYLGLFEWVPDEAESDHEYRPGRRGPDPRDAGGPRGSEPGDAVDDSGVNPGDDAGGGGPGRDAVASGR